MPKKIGNTLYYAYDSLKEFEDFFFSLDKYDSDFKKTVKRSHIIKYDANFITLIECYDIKKLNPVIKRWYRYENYSSPNNEVYYQFVRKTENSKTNPLILHRFEEMINYCEEKREEYRFRIKWTKFYENSGVALFSRKREIGRKVFWDKALAELKAKDPEGFSEFEDFI
ncbi:MAG: hypothetical protein ACRCX2_24210 [Paraclostridium sp.]